MKTQNSVRMLWLRLRHGHTSFLCVHADNPLFFLPNLFAHDYNMFLSQTGDEAEHVCMLGDIYIYIYIYIYTYIYTCLHLFSAGHNGINTDHNHQTNSTMLLFLAWIPSFSGMNSLIFWHEFPHFHITVTLWHHRIRLRCSHQNILPPGRARGARKTGSSRRSRKTVCV